MSVYTNIETLPEFKKAVITIGAFDGVHPGHLQIIRQLKEEAARIKGTPVLITFYPHPKKIISEPGKPVLILNTPGEKYELLARAGVHEIVVIPFDKAFADQHALNYIRDFLVDKFHPHTIITGYDHRFGKNREGDYKLLEAHAAEFNFIVKEIPEHVLHNVAVSSTRIREALNDGDVATANEFLAYPYFFSGKVVEGNKLGRTIGYPTANLQVEDQEKLIPGNGVYAVDVKSDSFPGILKGMMNIGVRPTIDGTKRVIEVNIFDFDKDLYGANVTVHLKKRLRNEVKFAGLETLKSQLAKDKLQAQEDNPF